MKKTIIHAFLLAVGLLGLLKAATVVYRGPLVNESALAYDNNYALNLGNRGIDTFSAQASYSSATIPSVSWTDGTQSTGSITVTSLTNLAGAKGTNTLTVLSTNSLTNTSITLSGTSLTEGLQWWTQTSTNAVATSLKNAINNTGTFTATTTGNRVNITCASSGTWCNNATLAVVGTSSITAGAASFSGGVDNAIIAINNVSLIQGRDWTVGASTAATATSIAAAINANTSLNTIITSTAPTVCSLRCGVVIATSTAVGTSNGYALFSSSQAALTLSGVVTTNSVGNGTSAMTGGTASGITLNSPIITAANSYTPLLQGQAGTTGLAVLYTSGSLAIGGLTNQTTYYVIPISRTQFELASSRANAVAGTYITITSSSAQTTAHTYSLAPLTITGTPSFKWQGSNDNSSWNDVNIASVTFPSPYTADSTTWDFGSVNYQYMRLAVIGPTTGGVNLVVNTQGKTLGNGN